MVKTINKLPIAFWKWFDSEGYSNFSEKQCISHSLILLHSLYAAIYQTWSHHQHRWGLCPFQAISVYGLPAQIVGACIILDGNLRVEVSIILTYTQSLCLTFINHLKPSKTTSPHSLFSSYATEGLSSICNLRMLFPPVPLQQQVFFF